MIKKYITIILFALLSICASGQEFGEDPFSKLDLDTIAKPKRFKPEHMLGVRYYYNFSAYRISPDVKVSMAYIPNSFGIVYTYYSSLWDMINIFGVQAALKYNRDGFDSKYLGSERYDSIEGYIGSQFHIDFKPMRALVNVGPYYGYRIANGREGGVWDEMDNRHDYGLQFGAGLAVKIKRFEFQLECNYKFSLSSVYHVNKNSDEYWMYAYPGAFMLSATFNIHLKR
jgi:hypothetical protein